MDEKLNTVMGNVMAALNTFGIEYDTNVVCGVNIHRTKEELLKAEPNILNFSNDYFNYEFKKSFRSFAERPQHSQISGKCWADDGKYVIIQFSRTYQMTEEDWDDYANACGCSDPFEAQGLYGGPNVGHIFLNVRILQGNIDKFVRDYAHFCW